MGTLPADGIPSSFLSPPQTKSKSKILLLSLEETVPDTAAPSMWYIDRVWKGQRRRFALRNLRNVILLRAHKFQNVLSPPCHFFLEKRLLLGIESHFRHASRPKSREAKAQQPLFPAHFFLLLRRHKPAARARLFLEKGH